MEDTAKDVRKKINGAFCEAGVVEGNPCLEYVKVIVFGRFGKFQVTRKEENGGNKLYETFEEVCKDFKDLSLHPGDLKASLSAAINEMLEPVREHFKTDKRAKELLKQVSKFRITR